MDFYCDLRLFRRRRVMFWVRNYVLVVFISGSVRERVELVLVNVVAGCLEYRVYLLAVSSTLIRVI